MIPIIIGIVITHVFWILVLVTITIVRNRAWRNRTGAERRLAARRRDEP